MIIFISVVLGCRAAYCALTFVILSLMSMFMPMFFFLFFQSVQQQSERVEFGGADGVGSQNDGKGKAANGNGVAQGPCPWKEEALYPSEDTNEGLNVSEGYKSVGFQRFQNEL